MNPLVGNPSEQAELNPHDPSVQLAIALNFFDDALDPASGSILPAISKRMTICQKMNPVTKNICGKPTSKTEIAMIINNEIRTHVDIELGINVMLVPPSLKIGSNITEQMCTCTICCKCVTDWHEEQIKEADATGILLANKDVTCPGCGKVAGKLPQLEGIMSEHDLVFRAEKACVRTPAFSRQNSKGGGVSSLMFSPDKHISDQKIVIQFPCDRPELKILEWFKDIASADLSNQYDCYDLVQYEVFPYSGLKREKFEREVTFKWDPDPADKELDIKISLTFDKADMATKFLNLVVDLETWQGESGLLAYLDYNTIQYRAVTDDWKPVISIVNAKVKRNINEDLQQAAAGGSNNGKSPKIAKIGESSGTRAFQTFAPQQVLSDFRDYLHNAGMPDLACENAEYITTNLKGTFPFELVTGEEHQVHFKEEPDALPPNEMSDTKQQDHSKKDVAGKAADVMRDDSNNEQEELDDVQIALKELQQLKANAKNTHVEATEKERPPTITGKFIEAQPDLDVMVKRWQDKEEFMKEHTSYITLVGNRNQDERGSMYNPYAGIPLKYALLIQGSGKWGRWACEPVDPNLETPGGPPVLKWVIYKAYFSIRQDICLMTQSRSSLSSHGL
jgi:hypothetical protein